MARGETIMSMSQLTRKVIEQMGYDSIDEECVQSLRDVANHGAGGGVGGFIYYNETNEFFDKNRALILTALDDVAENLGEDALVMVTKFHCLKDFKLSTTQVAKVIYGRGDFELSNQIKNALSWFALEEVAYWWCDHAS